MTTSLRLGLTAALLLTSAPAFAQQVTPSSDDLIVPFAFTAVTTRNTAFDRAAFTYPDGEQAGKVNANVGDVQLDAVIIDGVTYDQSKLQTVASALIVTDDGKDEVRGGGNITAGYGIGADLDSLLPQGPGSTTPTAADIAASQGNFNLSSITPVRENVGTVVYELSFAQPADALLLFERGGSGDVEVSALDAAGNVVDTFLVLDGANDADAPSSYAKSGIIVTTYVQDGFLNQGQELSTVGLKLAQPATTFRFSSIQQAEGAGAIRYNGPDLKVLALAAN